MKRTVSEFVDCVANYTRSKKRRLTAPLTWERRRQYWISASHTRNFMIKDPLVDWFQLYARNSSLHNRENQGGFTEFIMNKGTEFERTLVSYIDENKVPVVSVSEYITDATVRRTMQLMREGVPIIHSAPVKNKKNRTKGVIDLLVRSDYLHQLVEESPLSDEERVIEASKLDGNYHYVVIDVKFSTLCLTADGRHLLNSGSYPAYKAQTWIYTQAIGEMQGYTPRYSFILGRRWTNKSRKAQGLNCLDKLGVIDFQGRDKEYVVRTKNALQWLRDVKQFGNEWSLNPPTRDELYPNMCVESGRWSKQKEKLAQELGEITTVWQVGVKHRAKALEQGVTSWRDERCCSALLGMKEDGKQAPVIDAIININRQREKKILPLRVKNDMYGWKKPHANELYVDFETLIDVFAPFDNLPRQEKTDQIFMIGVYYQERPGSWTYKNFVCRELTLYEEFRIMNEFMNFVRRRGSPKMWYWHAEKTIWDRAENRQYDAAYEDDDDKTCFHISNNWQKGEWCDLLHVFKSEPIVIKGCFKFGLKAIVKAMNKNGLIETKMESECDSGMTAAIKAWKSYQTSSDPPNSPVIQDIAKYNEFDVQALYDIMTYLRANHR